MASLLDIPVLKPLVGVCESFRVHLELFGGGVTRLLTHARESDRTMQPDVFPDISLFAMSPPFTDIELSHSGHPSSNTEIKRALLDVLPTSECFRWDLRARSQWRAYRERAAAYNSLIPTRLMLLSSDPTVGFQDPFDGRNDIDRGQYLYVRNPRYEQSPLYRAGLDLEFLSGLLYLKCLLESPLTDRQLLDQVSLDSVEAVMNDARSLSTLYALRGNARLRARVRYLLAHIAALGHPSRADPLLERTAVRPLLGFIRQYDESFGSALKDVAAGPQDHGHAVISSSRLHGDVYRLPWLTEDWAFGKAAQDQLRDVLTKVKGSGETVLADGEHVVTASPQLPVATGRASSAGVAGQPTDEVHQEFVYLNIALGEGSGVGSDEQRSEYKDEDLAVFMAVCAPGRHWVYSLPGQAKRHPNAARILVSINTFGLLRQLELEKEQRVRFFLSAWKGSNDRRDQGHEGSQLGKR